MENKIERFEISDIKIVELVTKYTRAKYRRYTALHSSVEPDDVIQSTLAWLYSYTKSGELRIETMKNKGEKHFNNTLSMQCEMTLIDYIRKSKRHIKTESLDFTYNGDSDLDVLNLIQDEERGYEDVELELLVESIPNEVITQNKNDRYIFILRGYKNHSGNNMELQDITSESFIKGTYRDIVRILLKLDLENKIRGDKIQIPVIRKLRRYLFKECQGKFIMLSLRETKNIISEIQNFIIYHSNIIKKGDIRDETFQRLDFS